MGMAASQVRFLSLQNRKNTIGLNLMTLSNRKLALSRDMNRVANEYNDAMNMKKLQWSNNSGVTYSDLSYDTLMKPNDTNANLPYIITDENGRVVVDDKDIILDGVNTGVSYKDLAIMISSYSGLDDQKNTTYNNPHNVASDMASGKANELGYQIVSTANQTTSNSLRYDLMEKLGLITPTEVVAINDLNDKIGIENEEGKYAVGTLTGDYYLACANYEAYRNFLNAGDFEFGINSSSSLNNPAYKTKLPLDGSGDITYGENIDGSNGTKITFNGESYLSKVDLTTQFDQSTQSYKPITNISGTVDGTTNLSYSISGGGIQYTYSTSSIVDAMGAANITWQHPGNDYSTGKIMVANASDDNLADVDGTSWASLINNNATIILMGRNWTGDQHKGIFDKHISADFESRENVGYNNLKNFVTAMGNAIKTNNSIEIDEQAMNDAVKSTVAQFSGKITNNGKIYYHGKNRSCYRSTTVKMAYEDATNSNLVGWTGKPNFRMGSEAKNGAETVSVNAANVFNVLMSFYNYYYSKRSNGESYVVIEDAATAAIEGTLSTQTGSTSASNSIPDALNNYDPIEDTTSISGYTIKKGKYTDEEGVEFECTDYFDSNGHLAQRDLVEVLDDGSKAYIREYYDVQADGSMGTNAKIYVLEESVYQSHKNQVGKITGIAFGEDNSEASLYESPSSISSGVLELKIKNPQGVEETITINGSRGSGVSRSAYSTSIYGKPNPDILNDLKQVMDDAKAELDAAVAERDKYFDSAENRMMDYFDAIFKMIAENGWVYDENINTSNKTASNNYLNAKLQNNMYFITEVDTLDGTDFNYSTKIATNVSKVFEIYDKDAQNTALSEYEAKKAEINTKDKEIDIRMNKLEAEQDAISTELDSIKKIIEDNISTNFKIFT